MDYILIYSGVEQNERAAAGVGCIIHKDNLSKIHKWEAVTERILTIEIKQNKQIRTIIGVYGPDDNEKKVSKDAFWEELSYNVETFNGNIYILGDFNGRVGKKDNTYAEIIGDHGENVRNNNGLRLLDFCQIHNLIIANTFYQHKNIHKYTREQPSRKEKSIIDYVITGKDNRKAVLDVKVRRRAEINSDHYLVRTVIRESEITKDEERRSNKEKKEAEEIRAYKLREPETGIKYKELLEEEMKTIAENNENLDIETFWEKFKGAILKTAKTTCGVNRRYSGRKQTAWWNKDIKQAVKTKKDAWLKYINDRNEESLERYKEQRDRVKKLVRESKQRTWTEFGEKLEQDCKGNQKLFYKVLKNLRAKKNTDITAIRNEQGDLITDEQQITERWKQYFEKLLNPWNTLDDDLQNREGTANEDKVTIEKEELIAALKRLKNGKAAGHDKITGEMLKKMGEWGIAMLLKLINEIAKQETIPKDWTIGMILPIYKKGDKHDCNNYRGITLLSVVSKVYEQIIENKLRKKIEPTLTETQSGFRKGRSAQDHIFSLKNIIGKTLKANKAVYMAFLDLQKAFDRVPRSHIWKSLQSRNVSTKLINIVKSLYKNTNNCVISRNMRSETFTTKEGVRQGGSLSPLLFITYMDDIIKESRKRTKQMYAGHRHLQTVNVSELAFADDVVLLASSEENLRNNLLVWNEVLERKGMKLNKEKTKVMVTSKEKRLINILIEGERIEQVDSFQYLGVSLEETGNNEKEIADRIAKTNNIYYAMSKGFTNRREISRKTKMKVFKSIYVPVLTYGSESWVLSQQQERKIQAVEMKYLRRAIGVTRKDRIRNEQIREELEIQPISSIIENKQIGWWGHLQRLKDNIPVKQIWEGRTQDRNRRGRPKKTWNNTVENILQKKGKSIAEAKRLSQNKKEWRKFIRT